MAKHNDTTLLSASASPDTPSVTKDPGEPADSFNWAGLSQELRNMIYDCLLEDKVIREQRDRYGCDGYGNYSIRRMINECEGQGQGGIYESNKRFLVVATKPRTNLQLVSSQFAREYSERCEGRNELLVRADRLDLYSDCWSDETALQLNVLHLHLGDGDLSGYDTAVEILQRLRGLKRELTELYSGLPSLRAVYLKLYVGDFHDVAHPEYWLRSVVHMDKLKQLKITHCDNPEKCYDLSSRKHVLVDWKSGQLKASAVVAEWAASSVEYAESCCEGLSYDGPRPGDVARDQFGNYLGEIGEDRKPFMPIPDEILFDAGIYKRGDEYTPEEFLARGRGIVPDLMRAAGLGSYLDGSRAREDENDANAEHPAVFSRASRSDIASWVEDTDMNDIGPDADSTEENGESDNGDAVAHPNDNSMDRYYYGNMDGAMDDVEDYVSEVEVAETEAPTPATHEEAKESEKDLAKSFNFFGLSRELRDMIYAQPGMTEDRVMASDGFDGVLGDGNKIGVTITKPHVSLCLVSRKFSAECMEACEEQQKLFIRTSQHVHREGYTEEYLGIGFEHVKSLQVHMGDWGPWGAYNAVAEFARRDEPYDPVAESQRGLADLETFKGWLTDLCSRMPCLRTVSLKMYVEGLHVVGQDVFEGWLRSIASMDKFVELKVVEIESSPIGKPLCWDLRAKHELLLH